MPRDVLPSPPTSRPYRHRRCEGVTYVGDDDFTDITNPLVFCTGTMCVHCNKGVGLDKVFWVDTGESRWPPTARDCAARRRR